MKRIDLELKIFKLEERNIFLKNEYDFLWVEFKKSKAILWKITKCNYMYEVKNIIENTEDSIRNEKEYPEIEGCKKIKFSKKKE